MPSTAAELQAAIDDVFDGWTTLVHELADDEWDRPTGCPGWSVKDQLAHVVGLEQVLLGAPEPDHEVPDDLEHVRDEIGHYMERQIDVRRGESPEALIAELDNVVGRRRETLAALTDETLGDPMPGPMGSTPPAGAMLPIRVFDIWAHEQDVRRAVGRPGHLSGPAAEMSAGRIRKGLGRVLPERLGHPDATLLFIVHGDVAFEFAVDCNADADDDHPAPPTTRIELDWPDLVALACGRSDAPDPAEVGSITGDEALGRRALAELTVTP